MGSAMELSQENLRQIGEYVREHLPEWSRQSADPDTLRREMEIRERIVRVEEELKASRELMQQGFAAMEQRFADMNRRLEDLHRHTTRWMSVLMVFLGVIGALPWVMGAY